MIYAWLACLLVLTVLAYKLIRKSTIESMKEPVKTSVSPIFRRKQELFNQCCQLVQRPEMIHVYRFLNNSELPPKQIQKLQRAYSNILNQYVYFVKHPRANVNRLIKNITKDLDAVNAIADEVIRSEVNELVNDVRYSRD